MRYSPRGRQSRKGIVAVVVALTLTAVVGIVAISVDGGMLYLQLRQSRMTADAAAMAAACELFRKYPTENGLDPHDTAKNAALNVASSNGFANDETTSKVTVHIPPTSGIYQGQAGYAEVTV